MRTRFIPITLFGAALALACCTLPLPSRADDDAVKKPVDAATPDIGEMMKKWVELAAPGPDHKKLDPLVGEWEVESKFWMGGPDAPPAVSKGKATKRWILGNRFVHEDYKGEFMGAPFEGVGYTGYDKLKQKYVGVWMDSTASSLTISEGSAEGKVITSTGLMDDPMTGEKNKTMKYVLRMTSPEKHSLEIHDLSLGEKSRIGEITYTKKKS
jgi:hypothetical protein